MIGPAALHRRVGVERALRHRAVDALDLVEHRDDRLAAAVERRLHPVDGREVALDRGEGRSLRDVGDVGGRVRLEVRRRGHQVLRADHPADPPAGHRVGLGDAVDDHAVVGEVRAEHGQRAGLHAVVHEVLVDLVGERPQVVVLDPAADRADLVGGVDGAGRVRRRDEEQHLGARRCGPPRAARPSPCSPGSRRPAPARARRRRAGSPRGTSSSTAPGRSPRRPGRSSPRRRRRWPACRRWSPRPGPARRRTRCRAWSSRRSPS